MFIYKCNLGFPKSLKTHSLHVLRIRNQTRSRVLEMYFANKKQWLNLMLICFRKTINKKLDFDLRINDGRAQKKSFIAILKVKRGFNLLPRSNLVQWCRFLTCKIMRTVLYCGVGFDKAIQKHDTCLQKFPSLRTSITLKKSTVFCMNHHVC